MVAGHAHLTHLWNLVRYSSFSPDKRGPTARVPMHEQRTVFLQWSPPPSSHPPQQWHLVSPAGPGLLPRSLSCGVLLPGPSGCLLTANSGPLSGNDLEPESRHPHPRVSGCGVRSGSTDSLCSSPLPSSVQLLCFSETLRFPPLSS